MSAVFPEAYGQNLGQFQREYQDRFNAASYALGQSQYARLVPGEIEKIVEAVVARLARLVDPEKLAEELAPIC